MPTSSRRLRVAAGDVDLTSEGRLVQQHPENDGDRDKDEDVVGNAVDCSSAEGAEDRRDRARRRAVRPGEADALQHDHRGERGEERRDLPLGDEEAVEQPRRGPDSEAEGQDRDRVLVATREARRRHSGRRHDGGDRKIEASHQDHEGLADDDDAERRQLRKEVTEIVGPQECRRDRPADDEERHQEEIDSVVSREAREAASVSVPPPGRCVGMAVVMRRSCSFRRRPTRRG